jgi:hypothetical protein
MPGMPDIVVQGPVLHRIAKLFQIRGQVPDLKKLLAELIAGRNLADLAVEHKLLKTKFEEHHVRTDWLDETGVGWWRTMQPIEPILRDGLIKAAELALRHDLPATAYWICAGPGHMGVAVGVSPWQVTITFITPPPEGPDPSNLVEDPMVWLTHRSHQTGKVETKPVRSMPLD